MQLNLFDSAPTHSPRRKQSKPKPVLQIGDRVRLLLDSDDELNRTLGTVQRLSHCGTHALVLCDDLGECFCFNLEYLEKIT